MGILYQPDCGEYVILAKEALIRARIASQEAQIMEEFDVLYGPDYLPADLASDLRVRAKENRTLAREALLKAEQINGQLYSRGEPIVPLRASLNGQRFRSWVSYHLLYKLHPFFKGVDPA